MNALINGKMSESNNKCAFVEDVGVEDFGRFLEFCYRNDFTVPDSLEEEVAIEPEIPSSEDTIQEKIAEPVAFSSLSVDDTMIGAVQIEDPVQDDVVDSWGSLAPSKKKGKKFPRTRLGLRTRLHNRTYLLDGDTKATILQRFVPQSNTKASQDFTPVFLAYARLYTFANMQLIGPLKALTLHKLHRTLLDFQLYVNRVGDVIKLARYAYHNDNTPDRGTDGSIDRLRRLVVEYIACEIDTIGGCSEFVELMEDGGEFVGDFWDIARKYLKQST